MLVEVKLAKPRSREKGGLHFLWFAVSSIGRFSRNGLFSFSTDRFDPQHAGHQDRLSVQEGHGKSEVCQVHVHRDGGWQSGVRPPRAPGFEV